MFTVGLPATAPRPFFTGAGTTSNLTSGGIDNGARPMCEAHDGDEEKDREEAGVWKAGTRKEGIEMEDVDAIALSRPRARAVDNMLGAGNWFCLQLS